jgi:4a-hydroxytetrahydrobiopterin dehydratase
MVDRLTPAMFSSHDGLDDWRVLLGRAEAMFRAGSFAAAATLAGHIASAADEANHHPDIDIRYPDRVHVVLTTHATGGLTDLDVSLARSVSALARDAGCTSEPLSSRVVEIAIDALDIDRVRPFWVAVLGYREVPPGDGQVVNLVDPLRIGPPVWFQQMDAPRPQRNRVHLDVTVPHDIAEERVAAAVAAGGTLLTDRYARAFWVLADPEGNEACISTWQDRN